MFSGGGPTGAFMRISGDIRQTHVPGRLRNPQPGEENPAPDVHTGGTFRDESQSQTTLTLTLVQCRYSS